MDVLHPGGVDSGAELGALQVTSGSVWRMGNGGKPHAHAQRMRHVPGLQQLIFVRLKFQDSELYPVELKLTGIFSKRMKTQIGSPSFECMG